MLGGSKLRCELWPAGWRLAPLVIRCDPPLGLEGPQPYSPPLGRSFCPSCRNMPLIGEYFGSGDIPLACGAVVQEGDGCELTSSACRLDVGELRRSSDIPVTVARTWTWTRWLMALDDRLDERVILVAATCNMLWRRARDDGTIGRTAVDRLPAPREVQYTGRLKPSERLRC